MSIKHIVISSPQSMNEWMGKGSASKEGREHAQWFVREVEPLMLKMGLKFDPVTSAESNFTFQLAGAKPGLETKIVAALEKKFRVKFEVGMQNAIKPFHMVSSKIEMGTENPYFSVVRWMSGKVTATTIIGWNV